VVVNKWLAAAVSVEKNKRTTKKKKLKPKVNAQ